MTIRLVIADDQALVRGALAALLGLEADIEVVAELGTGPVWLQPWWSMRLTWPCWMSKCQAWMVLPRRPPFAVRRRRAMS